MKCNLLLFACLLGLSSAAFAQKKNINDQFLLSVPGSAALRSAGKESAEKIDYKMMNTPLPKFDIFNHENKNITSDVLGTGGNIFVMMFNPTCDHCEDQTILFEKNIDLFKKTRILLVAAPGQVQNFRYFESNVKFSKYASMITVSVDSAKLLEKLFNYVELPQINIYDGKTHKLLKTMNSLQPLDSFSKFIN